MRETVLSILDGHSDQQRVVVALRHFVSGGSQMVLCHETWSEDIGWFAQSTVELSGSQVGGLRAALGVQTAGFAAAASCRGCPSEARSAKISRDRDDATAPRHCETISMVAHRAG